MGLADLDLFGLLQLKFTQPGTLLPCWGSLTPPLPPTDLCPEGHRPSVRYALVLTSRWPF